jgi:putative nucleotidyltransferase with HDIG domain
VTQPPRLLARALAATCFTVAVILTVTFVVLIVATRQRVRAAEIEKLQSSQGVFAKLEARDQRRQQAFIATIAEHPRLKAALSTYAAERRFGGLTPDVEAQARATIVGETEQFAEGMDAEVLAIVGTDGKVFLSVGPGAAKWPVGATVFPDPKIAALPPVVVLPSGAFRISGARLDYADGTPGVSEFIGHLVVATSLDANYAQEVSRLAANAAVVITVGDAVAASMVPEPIAQALATDRSTARIRVLNGEEYAIGALFAAGPVRISSLTSIDAAARAATREALTSLGWIALGSAFLAMIASLWLARTLTGPIDRLAHEIAAMTATHNYTKVLEQTGTSRELDALADAFNELMRGLTAAEAETRSAYLGAIRALAAALDARDPYTAGHSERVSALSVVIARQLQLSEGQVDVIRLGALLHDVGKIGVPDEVLRKPGPLTTEEFEHIKRHPTLGARILRQVPFLAPHLPIVELHHERPDGKGYPFGLRAEDIPLDARIDHVADAFDAMTSARAYRPARAATVALAELQRFVGTEFDGAVVDALVAGVPSASALSEPQLQELLGRGA